MPWTRLDPAKLVQHLHAECGPAVQDGEALAEQVLAQVREELLSGRYVAVQDHLGETFIGTEDEVANHMMEHPGM